MANLTKNEMYIFIKKLEETTSKHGGIPFRFVWDVEFMKLRQIINFYYTHGGK